MRSNAQGRAACYHSLRFGTGLLRHEINGIEHLQALKLVAA